MLPNDFPIPTSKIDAMISLEIEFSQFLYDLDRKRDQIHRNLTLNELTNITSFNFTKLIKDYLLKEFTKLYITESEPILVDELNYIINVSNLYLNASKFNSETLTNLMVWSFVKDATHYLPKLFQEARLDFDKVYRDSKTIPPRYRLCANVAINQMPFSVGRLYINESGFDDISKQSVKEMVANILNEFKFILTNVDWMDNESKVKAMEKANNIDVKMAYPEFIYNDTHLNTLYNVNLFRFKFYIYI
jgi:predicted metalloendopeptidase